MRRLRYGVATSLDGFIAGPNGEVDWIMPPETGSFGDFSQEFDTLLMGRRTYEITLKGPGPCMPGMNTIVCSHSLERSNIPAVSISHDGAATVRELKSQSGKDIWLFGGATLFRSLIDAKLVDTIELGVMPILLTEGLQLLPPGSSLSLELVKGDRQSSNIMGLTYAVRY